MPGSPRLSTPEIAATAQEDRSLRRRGVGRARLLGASVCAKACLVGGLAGILNGPVAGLGFGGVAGALVGYSAKKLTKLVAVGLGIIFILMQVLVHEGFITVNWMAVQTTAHGVWSDPQGTTLADRAWNILVANLPFGGGFIAGFAVGFKFG